MGHLPTCRTAELIISDRRRRAIRNDRVLLNPIHLHITLMPMHVMSDTLGKSAPGKKYDADGNACLQQSTYQSRTCDVSGVDEHFGSVWVCGFRLQAKPPGVCADDSTGAPKLDCVGPGEFRYSCRGLGLVFLCQRGYLLVGLAVLLPGCTPVFLRRFS